MPKMIFFDIDNTLWDFHMEIPDSTVRAIHQLHENGHLTFLCTGRARGNVRSEKLLSLPFDGIVAACGNHIEYQGKLIHERLFSQDELKEYLAVCLQGGLAMILEGPEYHWIDDERFGGHPYIAYLHQSMGERAKSLHIGEQGMEVNKFSVLLPPGCDYEGVCRTLEEKLDFIKHDSPVAEIVPKGTSKASGIQWLCDYLEIPVEDTYAIGDSANDLDMIRFVGHGIAMGNGCDAVKEAAEYVTDDLHADGLYHAMKHYGLI